MEGIPVHWAPLRTHDRYLNPSEDEAQEGRFALKMGVAYTYSLLSQTIDVDRPLGGKTVVFCAHAKASEPNSVGLAIRFGAAEVYGEHDPGDGEWHQISVTYAVPEDSTDTSFTVMCGHGGQPKQHAYFDALSIKLDE